MEKIKAPFRASLPQLFSESRHKRDEWHIWMSSWGFLCMGQTQDPAGGKPAAACHISVNYPNDIFPTKEHESRLLLYFMKITLRLLTNINWILSMLSPASGVWGSLQVHECRQRGSWRLAVSAFLLCISSACSCEDSIWLVLYNLFLLRYKANSGNHCANSGCQSFEHCGICWRNVK